MIKIWYYSSQRHLVLPQMQSFNYQDLPQKFQFQTQKGLTLFLEDVPVFSKERGVYTLKSLQQIFHKNINWANYKSSIYNCVYYIHEPTETNVFSILKISSNRYLFAYQTKYLNKTEVEQIVFELFIEKLSKY